MPLISSKFCNFEVIVPRQCGVNASGMETAKLRTVDYIKICLVIYGM